MEFDIAKHESEIIKVQDTEYRGRRLVDIRVYYLNKTTRDWYPSRKGISINMAFLDQVVVALRQLAAEEENRDREGTAE